MVPQNGWFLVGNAIKMDDDWEYLHFRKAPNPIESTIESTEIRPPGAADNVTCGASAGSSDMCEVHNFRPPQGPEVGDVMGISWGFNEIQW